jgi:hypothetical protein
MSQTLRDQLLKAGLVSRKQVHQADRQIGQQQFKQSKGRKKDSQDDLRNQSVRQAQAIKATRDRELNRQKQARAELKAREAQLKQLVAQHRLPDIASDDFYNFVDDGKVRRIPADAAVRARIVRGDLCVVRSGPGYVLVPSDAAIRIRECCEKAVINLDSERDNAGIDKYYEEFKVPDDLVW